MTKGEIRMMEMLVRVRQYILSRPNAFPAGSLSQDLYANVDASIKSMEQFAATQAMHKRGAKEKTVLKKSADDTLRASMEALSRTARSMKRSVPGVEEKFRLPSNRDGQTWLAFGRGFATEAELMADEFINRGMPRDFIDDLKAHILAVEQFSGGRALQTNKRIASTAGVGEAAEQGLVAVRELDAIVRNIYAGNAAELAAWESARHIERAPRHADNGEKEEPPASLPPTQG